MSCGVAVLPQDFAKVQAGSLSGLLTSGLLHSGLAGLWLYTRALYDSAYGIEVGWGSMELLAVYAVASVCASLAHLAAGSTVVGIAGAGAVLGVYTAWTILAVQHLKDDVPVWGLGVNAGLVLLLSLGFGVMQPAIGAASVVGGVLGGALALKLAVPLAQALKWGMAVPFLVLLFVVRMGVDAVKLLLLALVPLIIAAVQGVTGLVQTVRRV